MHVFPAQVPAAEARRADIVEVRVARKVAPLFGLGRDIPPFRRSWVCDFTALSLAEIGRGAPSPDRSERSRLESARLERPPGEETPQWAWSGRAVWSPQQAPLPGALSNATLNRYGPDTKAAAVLSAANRLLQAPTAAVAAAARRLADTGCDAEVRLAVWAGLVLEVYRSQPALVVAAVQARQVQRSLSARWGAQVDQTGVSGVAAPSEIRPREPAVGGDADGEHTPARWRPTSFDLVDSTLPPLGLADESPAGPGPVTADALDDIASAWCRRLLAVGRPGRGVVWLVEDDDGSRRTHAMVRVGAVVAPFVAATLSGTPAGERVAPPALPAPPEADPLAAAPLLERRAHLLVAHVAASYVRYRDELLLAWPELRRQTRDLVTTAVHRCAGALDQDDPVPPLLQAYAAYLEVWDAARGGGDAVGTGLPALKRGTAEPPRDTASRASTAASAASVEQLIASQWRVTAAWEAGRLDPGAVAYLLEIGIVALNDATAGPGVDTGPAEQPFPRPGRAELRAWWSAILTARGLDPEADPAAMVSSLSEAQVFHLHHYAAWLAAGGRRNDLRRALALQERVAVVRADVVRRESAGFAAKSAAARAAHESAAEIATDLALATPERERRPRAAALESAVRHAHAVLVDPGTDRLLRPAGAHPATVRTAEVVARALRTAAAHTVAVGPEDALGAIRLLDAATAAPTAGDVPGGWRPDEARRARLLNWRTELATLPGRRPSGSGRTAEGADRARPGRRRSAD